MAIELPALPYEKNALEPYISAETLEYHYGKHHQAYISKLNELVKDTADADKPLEEIVKSASGVLFNQAAQAWNHTFYWNSLSPQGGGEPGGELAVAIEKRFGTLDKLKEEFNAEAEANFGSGWTWLVKTPEGGVEILNTDDADTPLARGQQALLAVDIWEHAYYIDYRNARPEYLDAIWNIINWDFAARNFG